MSNEAGVLKKMIVEIKRERYRLKKQVEILPLNLSESDYWPSEANVENWQKYGPRWPGIYQSNVKGEAAGLAWKLLSNSDWVSFYEWLIDYMSNRIESIELMIEENEIDEAHIPPEVKYAIDFVAKRADTPYEKVKKVLTTYHIRGGTYKEVKDATGLDFSESTFCGWKERTDDKVTEILSKKATEERKDTSSQTE